MSIHHWFQRSRLWGVLLALGLLAACSNAPPSSADSSASRSSVDEISQAAPADAMSPPAPASTRASADAAAPAAKAQLGTQWGEGRESRVTTVRAHRIAPDLPDEVAAIGYNDAASVRASTGPNPERQLNLLLAQGDVEWSVRDENDRPLALQRARRGGDGMFRIAGQKGARYVLVLRNLSDRNYEVVTTVDGLDVLSGQPGSLSNTGYVLRARDTLRIEGFRKSDSEVAAFRFAAPGRAYAANTEAGDVRNIGVIGAALFELEIPGAKRTPRRGAGGAQPNPFPADGGSTYAPPPNYRK